MAEVNCGAAFRKPHGLFDDGVICTRKKGHEGPHQKGTRASGGFTQWADELCEGKK